MDGSAKTVNQRHACCVEGMTEFSLAPMEKSRESTIEEKTRNTVGARTNQVRVRL